MMGLFRKKDPYVEEYARRAAEERARQEADDAMYLQVIRAQQAQRKIEEQDAERKRQEWLASPEKREADRRAQVFSADCDAWIERLRLAQKRTGANVLTQESLDLAGQMPVVDARGMKQLSARVQTRALTDECAKKVRLDILSQVQESGGPVGFWGGVVEYLVDNEFEMLNDSVV